MREVAALPKDSKAEPKNLKIPPGEKRADCKGRIHAVIKPKIIAINPDDVIMGRTKAFTREKNENWEEEVALGKVWPSVGAGSLVFVVASRVLIGLVLQGSSCSG